MFLKFILCCYSFYKRNFVLHIFQACGLTSYWKSALFKAASLNEETSTVSKDEVCNMWKKLV